MPAEVDWKFFFAMKEVSSKLMGEAAAAGCLFKVGKKYGKMLAETVPGKPEQKISNAIKLLQSNGWGSFKDFPSNDGSVSYTVSNSPIAAGTVATAPICHILRGMLSGIHTAAGGTECVCSEESCMAAGASLCRFVVTPASNMGGGL